MAPSGIRVLLVEAKPADAETVRACLADGQAATMELTHAGSLEAALGLAAEPGFQVGLLGLDRPDGSALEALRSMQQHWPYLPVILLCGVDDAAFVAKALQHGAQDCLLKGHFDAPALRRAITSAIKRQQAEAQIRFERDFAETLIETAHVMVLLLNSRAEILRMTSYTEEVCGLAIAEAVGENFVDLLVVESQRPAFRAMLEEVYRQRHVHSGLFSIRPKSGPLRTVRWVGKTVRDLHGRLLYVLLSGHDITDLVEAQNRALQSERLAAIGQMIASLAHESRNALQRSHVNLDLLSRVVKEQPKAGEYIGRIQNALEHLQEILSEVRNYAAPIVLAREVCGLDNVLAETWGHIGASREGRDVRLTVSPAAFPLDCQIDRMRIGQIFRNVLENAIAACQDPVEIQVAWSETQIGGQPAVQVSIRDNGPGIPAENRQKVFEAFFTTKQHGTGLGMPICKRIAEAHGGQIELGPDRGRGAEIIVTLPRRPAEG